MCPASCVAITDGRTGSTVVCNRHATSGSSTAPRSRSFRSGPRRTRLRYSYTFASGQVDPYTDILRMSSEVTTEDVAICEAVQRNLDSGVYDEGWLSPRHERGVAAFQRWIRAAVD